MTATLRQRSDCHGHRPERPRHRRTATPTSHALSGCGGGPAWHARRKSRHARHAVRRCWARGARRRGTAAARGAGADDRRRRARGTRAPSRPR
eukprot:4164052-Prymnesium_polylepis.1